MGAREDCQIAERHGEGEPKQGMADIVIPAHDVEVPELNNPESNG
jgi:hypothetical protein